MTLKKILEITAAFYDIKVKDICSARRVQGLAKARQVICYLARTELNKSSPSIGKELGGRDHTTVLYAAHKIGLEIHENEGLNHEVNSILKLIKSSSNYTEKRPIKQKRAKKRNLVVALKRPSRNNFSLEQLQRQKEILKKYKEGFTFAEIAKKYNLTRERIRQITERALLDRAYELLDRDIKVDIQKFLSQERYKHLLKMKKKHRIFPKKPIVEKEKRWSKHYNYCRKCATKTIKHHSHGYCKKCYSKTVLFKLIQKKSRMRNLRKRKHWQQKYFKEYNKRPYVIARRKKKENLKNFGGNREKAIDRDGGKCQSCGISRKESFKKYGRDLYVKHIDNKQNHKLENLITICKKCYLKKK